MQNTNTANLEKKAIAELNSVLKKNEKFVKVHAAEYLIWTGYTKEAKEEFLKEEKLHSTEPMYRVVIWRVLAQAEKNPEQKKIWLNKIYSAYQDMGGPDRIHASETLAKLKQPVSELFPQVTAKTLVAENKNLQTYALWASSYGSDEKMNENREKFLEMALTDTNVIIKKISAFILKQIEGLNNNQWNRLADAAISTDKKDEIYVSLLTAAFETAPKNADHEKFELISNLLLKDIKNFNAGQRTDLAKTLAEKGDENHLPVLLGFLENKDSKGIYDPSSDEGADLRAAAAYAILKIKNREK